MALCCFMGLSLRVWGLGPLGSGLRGVLVVKRFGKWLMFRTCTGESKSVAFLGLIGLRGTRCGG